MKVNFKCWTWGMDSVRESVNKTIDIINYKDWTEEEVIIIEEMFKNIEDSMESLKESAWGDDL